MLAGVFRRSAPRASAMKVDWSKMASACVADESKAFVLALKQEVATADAMHEKYAAKPASIDWASYKEFFGDHPEIAKLQSKYEASKDVTLPSAEPESDPLSAKVPAIEDTKDIDWETSWKSYRELFDGGASEMAAKQKVNTEAKVSALTDRETLMMENRTNEQSTVEDIWKKYPHIEEEVNNEVANHEWCTNLK